jgi:hypothetical protein
MKVHQPRLAKGLSMKKRKRHSPEQIVKKLRDADALLAGVGVSMRELNFIVRKSESM